MAKGPVISIGSGTFSSKAAAERHIRQIFRRYPPMGALTGADLEFALALIDMHPSRAAIVDCGIRSIHIQPVPFHEAQRRFLVKRKDGSIRDFSWRHALSPRSGAKLLASILRHVIHVEVYNFRRQHFRGVCETCAAEIGEGDCHIDHAYPDTFERLMEGWLGVHRLTPDDISVVRRAGYEEHSSLEDPALTESWIEYHATNARLRCVCRKCNLSMLRASRRKVA